MTSIEGDTTAVAVIFDLDGLLIDSEPLWHRAEKSVFRTVGIEMTTEMCMETTGVRIDEVVEHWYGKRPWDGPTTAEIVEAVLDEMERLLQDVSLKDGARQALGLPGTMGLRTALASSSSLRLIDAVLDGLSLREYFEVVHSAENEALGKPHPAVYLSTARLLGVAPQLCLAIEDSFAGATAAAAAGMRCIAIPETPDPAWAGDDAPAGLVLDSLAQLDERTMSSALGMPRRTMPHS